MTCAGWQERHRLPMASHFAWHQHVNANAARPVRYLEITTLPLMKALGAWRTETEKEESAAPDTRRSAAEVAGKFSTSTPETRWNGIGPAE